ncbi:MAG: c-type cytochrome [Desulfuromonadales bacterium]|nr:c-type cytochrome [Desulfuromonadales bacterium]
MVKGTSVSIAACLTLFAVFFLPLPLAAQESGQLGADREIAQLAEKGESLFAQKCTPCHAIGGGDRPTGPDLAGITERRERQWIRRFILDPQGIIADDPAARQLAEKYPMAMPDLGLSEAEAEALIAFLAMPTEEEHQAGEVTAPPAAAGTQAGDPRRGEALYIGSTPFSQGGAPCLACHGIAGHGLAGGASFGPDLSAAYASYGAEGMVSMLESMPFPSMEPIYLDHPLTAEESRDLTAFLAEVSGETPRVVGPLARDAGLGALFFFAVTLAFGWHRLRGVRRPLVEKMRNRIGGEPR